jgi:hypothetical protein
MTSFIGKSTLSSCPVALSMQWLAVAEMGSDELHQYIAWLTVHKLTGTYPDLTS